TPGVVKVTPEDISVDIKLAAENQDFETAAACLAKRNEAMTGSFDFKGKVAGQGKADQLVKALKGKLEYIAKDGRIYRHVPLKKILAYLHVTEVFKGQLPDMNEEGFPYKSITVKTDLKNGTLSLKEGILDSVSMKIIAKGDWDLVNDKINFVVLVAPLKTVDSIVTKIPLVRRVFKDSLVSIPVKVKGDFKNPEVTPLSPSAVGSEILGIMGRTLKLPFTLLDPIMPKKKENQDGSQKTNNKDLQ
ncbi:AsmA-like C-terminal region-containing protein, partial [bacterium]|nr:AsmA-like C-terminal region-containing protein [bacterium]